jgi:hypothetical protein
MTTALDVAGDLDAALERLRGSLSGDSADEQRRAVRDVLACAYELREYRNRAADYQDTAEKCADGLVTEAITALRGRLVHDFVSGFGPQSGPVYPRPDLYPSEDLWPGDNLVWRRPEDMGRPLTREDMPRQKQAIFDAYTDHVAGLPVLQPLQRVRRFLTLSTILGSL